MSRPRPLVIVTLPAVSTAAARTEIEDARRAGADGAELRFDRWSEGSLADVEGLFPAALPLLATLRSRAEGGSGPDEPAIRRDRLLELARHPFRWIDLEEDRDLGLLPLLPSPESVGRIVSVHLPPGVPPEEWSRRLRSPAPPGSMRKVVARSDIGNFLTKLLPEIPSPDSEPPIALTVGASGPLSRAWSRRLGLPMVFAAPAASSGRSGSESPVEPSQIPVDRLRPYLDAQSEAPLFGIAGHPVGHSHSPALHARWMHDSGHTGLYLPLDFATEPEFVGALEALAEGGFRGLNVTHPWKGAALAAATESSAGADACGVANTLTFRSGEIEAENTDLLAVLRRLDELERGRQWDGRSISVVGTGGAARATLAAARSRGAEPHVYARRRPAAEALADEFGGSAPEPGALPPDSLVVHATTVGRVGATPLGIPLGSLVGAESHVLDWVYAPESDEVRRTAVAAAASYEDGTRLLVYQAAASFGIWWGAELTDAVVKRTLREEGCAA